MARASSAATDSSSARGSAACLLRHPANNTPRSCPYTCTGTQSTCRISTSAPIIGSSGDSPSSSSTVFKPTSNSAGKGGSGDNLDHSAGVASPSLSASFRDDPPEAADFGGLDPGTSPVRQAAGQHCRNGIFQQVVA